MAVHYRVFMSLAMADWAASSLHRLSLSRSPPLLCRHVENEWRDGGSAKPFGPVLNHTQAGCARYPAVGHAHRGPCIR